MSKSDFDAFVKRQQTEKQQEAAFDPKQQLAQWLGYLDDLYSRITAYLQAYIESGAAQIEYRDIPINEEFIGAYIARQMRLKIGRSIVTFTPIGTMLIGTKGRVDVEGPFGTARLSLVNKQVTSSRQLFRVMITRPDDRPPAAPPSETIKQLEWTWKISPPPPETKFIELSEEAFFDMILAVANA
jgi:hypothetical protein